VTPLVFFLSVFFLVETTLSLSPLSKKVQEGTRNDTRIITHHKKKNRTERSLFTLSLSLVLFSKTNKLFSSVVFAKTS
jgi:hypothetical protein